MSVRPLGVGWDNTAYEVASRDAGAVWVFRFPRRTVAVSLLENECRVLGAIAPRLPLPIPVPEHFAQASERFAWPFAGYRRLAGVTADAAGLEDSARVGAAKPLGRFLGALHGIESAVLALEPDNHRRLDLPYRVPPVEDRLRQLLDEGAIDDDTNWQRIIEALPADWVPGAQTVVHGDLYARHVLVDEEGAPAGVIDWGDVHRGDAVVDLGLAHGFLPPSALEEFRDAYGPVDDDAWRVARFKALQNATLLPLYGRDVGDEDLVREGLTALRFLSADA